LRFAALDHRFAALDHRFQGLDRRFEGLDGRFEGLDGRFEALEYKLLAACRGELLAAVTAQTSLFAAQTRTLVVANLGAVMSVAALAFGAAKLS
jgi:hypothetical protein